MYCKAHGGGKRCSFAGCTKGAEGSTPLCKAHGGENAAFLIEVAFAPKVYMEAQNFVLLTVVERGVLLQVAPRVHVAVPTAALGMVEVSDASLKDVGRVLKGAQIFARPMVEESDVAGRWKV